MSSTAATYVDRLSQENYCAAGLHGRLDGKITIERLGAFHCGSRQLETFYHSWEDSHPPGRAIHAAYRVVLLEGGSKYVGQYRVPDRPFRITPTAILFKFHDEDGNIIKCDGDDLPESVLVGGESSNLSR